MDNPSDELCLRCGHRSGDHIPTQDAPDGERYPGQCNECSCSQFRGTVDSSITEDDWEEVRTNDGHTMSIPRQRVSLRTDSFLNPEDLMRLKVASTQIRGINSARNEMIEFRVTFGWNQSHGPYPQYDDTPGDPYGHYTTVFAPSITEVIQIIRVRYQGIFAEIYPPHRWTKWTAMEECKELEKIQYHPDYDLPAWPEKRHFHAGIILGRGK